MVRRFNGVFWEWVHGMRGRGGRMLGEWKQETETNQQQEESIWEIPSNVTTDIPQSLPEATPNPYPVGSVPIRFCRKNFFRYLSRNSTGYSTSHAQGIQVHPAQGTIVRTPAVASKTTDRYVCTINRCDIWRSASLTTHWRLTKHVHDGLIAPVLRRPDLSSLKHTCWWHSASLLTFVVWMKLHKWLLLSRKVSLEIR